MILSPLSIIGSCLLFLIVSLFGVAVPFILGRFKFRYFQSYSNSFASGCFLSLGFLHILCESVTLLEKANIQFVINGEENNWAYFLATFGYLIVHFLESITPHNSKADHCELINVNKKCSHSNQNLKEIVDHDSVTKNSTGSSGNFITQFNYDLESTDFEDINHVKHVQDPILDVKFICLFIALIIHSIFEGILVGASTNNGHMILITLLICAHKWTESFALTLQVSNQTLRRRSKIIIISIFCLSSPIGLIASAISADNPVFLGICNAIGAGVIIYISGEISHDSSILCDSIKSRLLNFSLYIAGFTAVTLLTLIEKFIEST